MYAYNEEKERIAFEIERQGFSQVKLTDDFVGQLRHLGREWNFLTEDSYLDKGLFGIRKRGYGVLQVSQKEGILNVDRTKPLIQTKEYNKLFGGVERYFGPLPDPILNSDVFRNTLSSNIDVLHRLTGCETWDVGAHVIRMIATVEREAHPAPEGIHQDGFDYVSFHLINRWNVLDDEAITCLLKLPKENIVVIGPLKLGDSMIVDDRKLAHFVTPFRVKNPNLEATRDILIFTYTAHQSPKKQ